MSKPKKERVIRCRFCNKPLLDPASQDNLVCFHCLDKGRSLTVAPAEDEAEEAPRRKKKRRRPVTVPDEDDDLNEPILSEPRTVRPDAFLYAMGGLVIVALALAGMSRAWPEAAYWLTGLGFVTALAGAGWVMHAASEDGISLWVFFSGNGPMMIILVFVQLVALPVFTLVYLVLNVGNAWKPALLEFVGAGLFAAGVALWPAW
jgi:phage FluMu protein Com